MRTLSIIAIIVFSFFLFSFSLFAETLCENNDKNTRKVVESNKELSKKIDKLATKEEVPPLKKIRTNFGLGLRMDSPFYNSGFDSLNLFFKAEGFARFIMSSNLGLEIGVSAGVWKSTAFGATPYLVGLNTYLIYESKYFSLFGGADLASLQHPQKGMPNEFVAYYSVGVDVNVTTDSAVRLGGFLMPHNDTAFWGGILGFRYIFP